jgi:hypothetical protein
MVAGTYRYLQLWSGNHVLVKAELRDRLWQSREKQLVGDEQ